MKREQMELSVTSNRYASATRHSGLILPGPGIKNICHSHKIAARVQQQLKFRIGPNRRQSCLIVPKKLILLPDNQTPDRVNTATLRSLENSV